MMKVATSVITLRPQNEVYLVGYVGEDRKKPAIGVHDDPMAVSLLLQVKDILVLFISIDVIMISREKADSIKAKICSVLDIESKNIVISAIHSHSSANAFVDPGPMCPYQNPEYDAYITTQIVESIKGLDSQLVDAKAYLGKTKIRGYYSKRTNIEAPFDDTGYIIKFESEQKVIAAMCNFNCHATVLGLHNRLVSSDLIGEVRKRIGDTLGVTPYTFTGASGDISNRQYRQGNDYEELERVGKGVAEQLLTMNNFTEIPMEEYGIEEYEHRIQYDNTKYYDDYKKDLQGINETLKKEDLSLDLWKLKTSEQLVLEEKLKVSKVDFTVKGKVIRIGNVIWITFPGELATTFSLQLKKITNQEVILIGYADDYQGYFIEEAEYGKCYEAIASNTPKGETEKIMDKIGELL